MDHILKREIEVMNIVSDEGFNFLRDRAGIYAAYGDALLLLSFIGENDKGDEPTVK